MEGTIQMLQLFTFENKGLCGMSLLKMQELAKSYALLRKVPKLLNQALLFSMVQLSLFYSTTLPFLSSQFQSYFSQLKKQTQNYSNRQMISEVVIKDLKKKRWKKILRDISNWDGKELGWKVVIIDVQEWGYSEKIYYHNTHIETIIIKLLQSHFLLYPHNFYFNQIINNFNPDIKQHQLAFDFDKQEKWNIPDITFFPGQNDGQMQTNFRKKKKIKKDQCSFSIPQLCQVKKSKSKRNRNIQKENITPIKKYQHNDNKNIYSSINFHKDVNLAYKNYMKQRYHVDNNVYDCYQLNNIKYGQIIQNRNRSINKICPMCNRK